MTLTGYDACHDPDGALDDMHAEIDFEAAAKRGEVCPCCSQRSAMIKAVSDRGLLWRCPHCWHDWPRA